MDESSLHYTNPKNLKKLTARAYSLTCVTGVAVILPFILKASVVTYFDSTLATVGFVFSLFMLGMLVTEFINGHIVKYVQVKHELFAASALFSLCVIGMFVIHHITIFGILLFLCGLCFGTIVHIPNMLIVHAFPLSARCSKLNRLDFFFSLGAFVYPMIASWIKPPRHLLFPCSGFFMASVVPCRVGRSNTSKWTNTS